MLIAILLLSFPALAQDVSPSQFKVPEGGGIVYGDELGVAAGAPRGWVFDAESGVSQGLHAVMYPQGSTWAKATEVMYVNIARLAPGDTVSEFIAGDVASFKKKSPKLAVELGEPVQMVGGTKAEVRVYSSDAWGNHEAVAYVTQGTSVAIFVLSCRTVDGFTKSLPAFREMVANSFLAKMVFGK
jgi:hypothetical protein